MRLPDRRRPAPRTQDASEPQAAAPSPARPAPRGRPRAVRASEHAPAHQAPSSDNPAPDPASERALRRELTALLPEMRGFARFLARDRSQADDLVQDTVVRALAALPQFQPGSNLKAWVLTIERNAFYEHVRRSRREQSALQQRFADETHERPAQDARDHLSDLQRLLFALPPLLREALVLVGAQELSHDEAAAICGVPVGTMKARVSRGRTRLAAIMQRRAGLGPEPGGPERAGSAVLGEAAGDDEPG